MKKYISFLVFLLAFYGLAQDRPVRADVFFLDTLTTTERDAITTRPSQGALLYNSTVDSLQFWNGTKWTSLRGAGASNVIASDVGFDNTNLKVATGVTTQKVVETLDEWASMIGGTEVISGTDGILIGGDNLSFNITDTIKGTIKPIGTNQTFSIKVSPQLGIPITNIAADNTYVYIDQAGTVQQQNNAPTDADWYNKLFIQRFPSTGTQIVAKKALRNPSEQYAVALRQLYDLLHAVGISRAVGVDYVGKADLTITRNGGKIYEFGAGTETSPNITPISSATSDNFFITDRDSYIGGQTTTFPVSWDNNGTQVSIAPNKFVFHRIYIYTSGNTVMQLGQKEYGTIAEAKTGINNDPYVLNPNSLNGELVGFFIIGSGATATNTGEFVPYTLGTGGGGGGGATLTDQQIADAFLNIYPNSDTDATNDATLAGNNTFTGVNSFTSEFVSITGKIKDISSIEFQNGANIMDFEFGNSNRFSLFPAPNQSGQIISYEWTRDFWGINDSPILTQANAASLGVGGTDDQTLAEVLSQGNVAGTFINMNNFRLDEVDLLRFQDEDADGGNWSIREITNIPHDGDLAVGHIGVFRHAFPQSGTATQPIHVITKQELDNAISGVPSGTDDQTASEVPIVDAGDYFTGTNVEDALQELGNGTAGGSFGIVAEGTYNIAGGATNYTITHNLGYAPEATRINIQQLDNVTGTTEVQISSITSTTFDIDVISTSAQGNIVWNILGTGAIVGQTANEVSIVDASNNFTATDVEGALGELADKTEYEILVGTGIDDDVNAALATAGNVPVRITSDITNIDTPLLLDSGQTLILEGRTVTVSPSFTGTAVIRNKNVTDRDITVIGGTIDGTAATTNIYDAVRFDSVTRGRIERVKAKNVEITASGTATGNFRLIKSDSILVKDVESYDTWRIGVYITDGSNNTIDGGFFTGTHDSGIGVVNSPGIVIRNSVVDNCGTSDASNVTVNMIDGLIDNLTSINASGATNGNGLTIGHSGFPADYGKVVNSHFEGNTKGIHFQGAGTSNVLVTNNTIINNATGVRMLSGVEGITITNNVMANTADFSLVDGLTDITRTNNKRFNRSGNETIVATAPTIVDLFSKSINRILWSDQQNESFIGTAVAMSETNLYGGWTGWHRETGGTDFNYEIRSMLNSESGNILLSVDQAGNVNIPTSLTVNGNPITGAGTDSGQGKTLLEHLDADGTTINYTNSNLTVGGAATAKGIKNSHYGAHSINLDAVSNQDHAIRIDAESDPVKILRSSNMIFKTFDEIITTDDYIEVPVHSTTLVEYMKDSASVKIYKVLADIYVKGSLFPPAGQLVVNGDFSNGATGWDLTWASGSSGISGGVATIEGTGNPNGSEARHEIRQLDVFEDASGGQYEVRVKARRTVGTGVFYVNQRFTLIGSEASLTGNFVEYTYNFTKNDVGNRILAFGADVGTTVEIDDVIVIKTN